MTTHLPPMMLVIDADTVFRTTTSNALERSGFMVSAKPNAEEALKFMETAPSYQKPQVVILGASDAGIAIESAKIIKAHQVSEQSLIMIFISNENDSNQSDVAVLKENFHEIISRPFSQLELVTRIKDLLNEYKIALKTRVIAFGNIKMDLMSYSVVKNNREVHLGPTEFKILHYFLDNPHKIFSREEIMAYIWGKDVNMEVRTVDVHINRLRTALSEPGKSEPSIKTVRSAGYCLELPQPVR
jgi:two-component system, OmpR family, phosphate regulon response regulator PhoB